MFSKRIGSVLLLAVVFLFFRPLKTTATVAIPIPKSAEEQKIDQLYLAAQSVETRPEAIQGLKRFVEDKKLPFDVRIYALRKLESLNLKELEDYFLSIASVKEDDDKQMPRAAAYLAYWRTRVSHEPNPETQVSLLIEALKAQLGPQPYSSFLVREWAAHELCSRGVQRAFPAIVKSIESRLSDTRDRDKEVDLCRKQLDLQAEHPTRFKALVAGLKEGDLSVASIDLKLWAVDELGAMKAEEANSAMADYALYLQNVATKQYKSGNRELQIYYTVHIQIVKLLVENGWSSQRLKSYGINRDLVDASVRSK